MAAPERPAYIWIRCPDGVTRKAWYCPNCDACDVEDHRFWGHTGYLEREAARTAPLKGKK